MITIGDTPTRPESAFRHFLLVDDSTQWFARIVRVDPDQQQTSCSDHVAVESHELPNALGGDFLSNVYSREQVKGPIRLAGQTWGAWSLSLREYERIRRLIELHPAVEEARRLAAYEV